MIIRYGSDSNIKEGESMAKVFQAAKYDWDEVGALVGQAISEILGWTVPCRARYDDYDYWTVSAVKDQFTIPELELLLDYVDANAEMRNATIPEDADTTVCLDADLSRALLQLQLGTTWQDEHLTETGLWLIGITTQKMDQEEDRDTTVLVDGIKVDFKSLWPKDEFIERLFDAGGTIEDLDDLCSRYVSQYGCELYWAYPIPAGDYNGVYLVLVQEGVLSLPYKEIDSEYYELFMQCGTRLLTEEDLHNYTADLLRVSTKLLSVMNSLRHYLMEKEKGDCSCK